MSETHVRFKSGLSGALPSPSSQNDGLIGFTTDTNQLYIYLNNQRYSLGINYDKIIMKDGSNWEGVNTKVLTDLEAIFVEDTTYEDYPYRASIALEEINSSTFASVCFNLECATSGNYAPMCETYDGGLYVYSQIEDTIIIPSIVFFFND